MSSVCMCPLLGFEPDHLRRPLNRIKGGWCERQSTNMYLWLAFMPPPHPWTLFCVTLCSAETREGVWSAAAHVAWTIICPWHIKWLHNGTLPLWPHLPCDYHLSGGTRGDLLQKKTPRMWNYTAIYMSSAVICSHAASTAYPVTAINYHYFVSLLLETDLASLRFPSQYKRWLWRQRRPWYFSERLRNVK